MNVRALVNWLPDERSAALINSPLSIRYLCGFPVEDGIILAAREESFLFLTEREYAEISEKIGTPHDLRIRVLTGGKQLLELLVKYGIKRIFIEPDKMTVTEYRLFKEQLHYAEIDTSEELARQLLLMRSVKTDEEIIAIGNAQRICDKAYERLLGSARKGMTERQIASLLDFYLSDFGSERLPFPTVVRSGENTANPNIKPTDRPIREGEFLILEFGASYDGYCAKMCRTAAVGEITPRMDNAYNAVSCAISDGLRALRAGIGGKVADSVAKATLNAWDVDKYCSVNFAHGIGLEPVEPPYLGQNSSSILKANTALSVSCGVNIAGKFGVKIGDMASLTEDGCIDYTAATKSLIHI